MSRILTTKEIAKYLKVHEITICKYAAQGFIPAIRIGRVWRFDKEAVDQWIQKGQQIQPTVEPPTQEEPAETKAEKPEKMKLQKQAKYPKK